MSVLVFVTLFSSRQQARRGLKSNGVDGEERFKKILGATKCLVFCFHSV